jgi:hypothetical protein
VRNLFVWCVVKAAWVLYRLPALWMNPTAYAFWIMRERQKLQAVINRKREQEPPRS